MNANNETSINNMFSGCLSLSTLPDISKWNINNIIDKIEMFSDCISLLILSLDNNKFKEN